MKITDEQFATIAPLPPRQRAVKLTALLLCAFFALALVLSFVLILTNFNHDHDRNGEDGGCATCAHIIACAKLIERLGTVIAVAVVIVSMYGVAVPLRLVALQINSTSLISLKVRLNI
jgi:hypothetical protein